MTGPSGAGKTEVSKIISEQSLDILIINLDEISHELLKNNQDLKSKLIKAFSNKILDNKNNFIDRKKLGKIVFCDKQKLELLNSIIFSYITEKVFEIVELYKNKYRLILLDAPTLIQSKLYKICDKIIVVLAERKIKLHRIINRDKILLNQAIFRLDSQLRDEEYLNVADFVINNNNNFFELKRDIVDILKKILEDF